MILYNTIAQKHFIFSSIVFTAQRFGPGKILTVFCLLILLYLAVSGFLLRVDILSLTKNIFSDFLRRPVCLHHLVVDATLHLDHFPVCILSDLSASPKTSSSC